MSISKSLIPDTQQGDSMRPEMPDDSADLMQDREAKIGFRVTVTNVT